MAARGRVGRLETTGSLVGIKNAENHSLCSFYGCTGHWRLGAIYWQLCRGRDAVPCRAHMACGHI